MFAGSARQIIAPLRSPTPLTQLLSRPRRLPHARFSSTQTPNEPKPTGSLDHKTFYKTFGRPIAKVFLTAIFTYQVAYYFWASLRSQISFTDEHAHAVYIAIISDLETRIENLEQAKVQNKR
ncbi:hypothetical protein GQX73_g998 [Xylaria multiplex]|uniref:Uncharacterized protein n=1 Tax=Xylaria multiplex TaxID=323545 RepID=A0A7C8N421_9PEZI|nr:hypothetical protein GQX73_g998 [Xylaria multiplex]